VFVNGPVRVRVSEALDDLRMRMPEGGSGGFGWGAAAVTLVLLLIVGGLMVGHGLAGAPAEALPPSSSPEDPAAAGPTPWSPLDGPDSTWQPSQGFASFACSEIDVLVDPTGLSANALPSLTADVDMALDAVALATHRVFDLSVREGSAAAEQPEQSIVVSFVDELAELPGDDHDPTALAVGGTYTTGQTARSGYVVLLLPGPPAGDVPGGRVTLLEHELGHALGVDEHSNDPVDVMYPQLLPDRAPGWADGDLRALITVGCR
jgi:hypothetical protein